MNMIQDERIICAPATSGGGALSLFRISGKGCIELMSRLFRPANKRVELVKAKGYSLFFGTLSWQDEFIDEVVLSLFRAPYSYTGEDMIEISCHASPFIRRRVMEILINSGARAAIPGEFTMRAFRNGKMDLSQAEAVADIVASSTRASHRIAVSQMRGGFSAEIGRLRSELLRFASLVELELDFGEEDVEFADREELKQIVTEVRQLSDRLVDSFRLGNVIKNGIPVAIVGKPNSGKSTLLNAILNEERAIVSEIPGTTRDAIEDVVVINDLEYRFIDTAGLRDTLDVVESIGIRKTREKITQAFIILMVDEITEPANMINERANAIREMIRGSGKHLVILINKADLGDQDRMDELKRSINLESDESLVFISAKKHTGLERLREKLGDLPEMGLLAQDDIVITNARHYEALVKVSDSLERVIVGLDNSIPEDLIAIDIRQAIHYLGEITGLITTDEILGNIFHNFCIGK